MKFCGQNYVTGRNLIMWVIFTVTRVDNDAVITGGVSILIRLWGIYLMFELCVNAKILAV